jgi:hypothetical protein
MLSPVNRELVILDAIDENETYQDTMISYGKIIELPTIILIKKNMLVELYTGRYNIDGSLVNDIGGIFKIYTKEKKM